VSERPAAIHAAAGCGYSLSSRVFVAFVSIAYLSLRSHSDAPSLESRDKDRIDASLHAQMPVSPLYCLALSIHIDTIYSDTL